MEEKKVKLSKLIENPDNPRMISEFMLGKLTESVLVFPKMLHIRPLTINKDFVVLGGNQRLQVMNNIAKMEPSEIEDYLMNQSKYRMASEEKKQEYKDFWSNWLKKKEVEVRVADDFTPEEEKEYLTKDNLHYGEDDVDVLKKEYDHKAIEDYLGSVPWNLYDYDGDKINDADVDTSVVRSKTFKCGYVEVIVTDEEEQMLEDELKKYTDSNAGSGDGFLSYLLGIPYEPNVPVDSDESDNSEELPFPENKEEELPV